MKVAVTLEPGRMELQDVERPVAAPGEALIAVAAVGLCGSDFHLYSGSHPYARFPQTQGHEVVGRIAAFGPGSLGTHEIGELVVVQPFFPCGQCFACRRNRGNCCVDLKVMGAHMPGALAEFIVAPLSHLEPLGDLPVLTAAMVEPMTIGLQSVVRAGVGPGDTVVVLGAGPIGLAAVLGAADRGARVLVADRIADRLNRARTLGAEAVVDTSVDDLRAAVEAFTDRDGAAVVVEATGAPAMIRSAVDLVAYSGTVVVVGISNQEVSLPIIDLTRKEINILGSRNSTDLFGAAVDLVRRYADTVAPMVTHTFPFAEVDVAIRFAMEHPQEVEKVVILMEEEKS